MLGVEEVKTLVCRFGVMVGVWLVKSCFLPEGGSSLIEGQNYFCLEENAVNGVGVISVVDGAELQQPQQNGSAEHPSDREDK